MPPFFASSEATPSTPDHSARVGGGRHGEWDEGEDDEGRWLMLTHNAHEVSVTLELHGEDLEREVGNELTRVSREAARRMRELAPKFRSELTNSIVPMPDGELAWVIRPGVAHGLYREKGQPPGKHLPRFFDPASKPIVDWLASRAFAGLARVRKGAGRFTARELELRDRYMGLSWHVKHKGLKAQPFAEPTARELEQAFPKRMTEFVERLVRAANAGRPGAAT